MNIWYLKCKRSSLRSQYWMRLFGWISNTVIPTAATSDLAWGFTAGVDEVWSVCSPLSRCLKVFPCCPSQWCLVLYETWRMFIGMTIVKTWRSCNVHFSYRCLRVSPGFAKSRPKMLNIERRPLREFERITRERFKIITFSSSHLSQVKMCPLKRPVKTEKRLLQITTYFF